ncbi:MAG: hypothetical protein OXR66_07890 [Candidatus Woesearchaeota archaeon]|nr:hypothetical protein [Candidatus Woesearchaeota archaeon]
MLHTALTRTEGEKQFDEFVKLEEYSFVRTQVEKRDGKVFMRCKKRTLA